MPSPVQAPSLLPPSDPDQVYVRVAALNGGFVTLPEDLFVTDAVPGKATTVPSLCFLIEHPDPHGGRPHRIVYDLGIKRDLQLYVEGMRAHISKRQPLIHLPDTRVSLVEGGLDPSNDIDTCIISHVHWDHIGIPDDYPNTQFIVGSGSLHALANGVPYYPKSMMEIDPLPHGRTWELPPPTPDQAKCSGTAAPAVLQTQHCWTTSLVSPLATLDFFGDGSLYLVDSPGHILGHINALLRVGPGKWVYLGSDCAHDPRLLTGDKDIATYPDGCGGIRSVHSDLDEARQTLSNLRQFLAANEAQVEWIVAHDRAWADRNAHRFFPAYMY